ncbi:hypothetical protein P692DRAFT_2029495 [Suillus brevipes Sb2]|nr:hypothetical protein P692DRAFT_2029495 [Suillus brevipes Sb2]
MQIIASAPHNAPPTAAQHAEAPGLTNETPFGVINWASKRQLVRKSPINTLPEEIILHIFKSGMSSRNSQKRIDFAVSVSRVCHTWRTVAFSCSSLWADITITADSMYNIDGDLAIINSSLLRAKEFASRSRVFPLSVRLKLFVTHSSEYLRLSTIVIMNWLRWVLPRVKYLSVHCDTLDILWLVMKHLQTVPMEILETCKMKYGTTALSFYPSIDPPPPTRFLFLADQTDGQSMDNFFPTLTLPKLTRIKVSGLPVSWSQWSFTRLTSLSINFMTLHDRPSMEVLKFILTINSETLEKFEIQGAIQRFGTVPRDASELPTTLPRLTDLTLGYLSQWEAIIFFLHFEASALKHLKLCDISRSVLIQHWPQDFKDGFYLNNPIPQNFYALLPFNDFSSTTLLEHLIHETSPLEQVETLTLEHFSLQPVFSKAFLQNNDPLKHHYGARIVLAYRMLQSCSQLRCLTLIDPEECFIHALNMYPDGADIKCSEPAPALTHLYLASPHPDRLMLFSKRRAESIAEEKGLHVLDYLELATEKKDVGRLLEAIVSDRLDLSRLAKSSLVAEWKERFNT